MTKLFFISFFVLTVFSTTGQTSDSSFVSFWISFQKNIIAKDYNALSSKTRFPLKAQGQLDYDTEDKYVAKDFEKIFSKFLADEIFIVNDKKGLTKLVRYNFLKTYKLKPKETGKKWARIDDMEFEKINGKWWLTLIYDGHSKY